jgi:hypothetical protein
LRIKGEIDGHIVTFLLDTGAHITICGPKIAEKLTLKNIKPASVSGVLGVGSEFIPAIGEARINLKIGNQIVHTEIVILNKEVGQFGFYDVVVGRSTLRKLPFLLDLSTGRLIPKETNSHVFLANSPNEYGFEDMVEKSDLKNRQEKEVLFKCMVSNSNVFSAHEYDLGTCELTAPTITTTTEKPICVKPYPIPEKLRSELKRQIGEMIKIGVLKESNTPWVHNVVMAQKSDGSIRLCTDFRPLNKITIPDPYPLPRMDVIINKVSGNKWLTKLDLRSGFWQIPLDEQSSYKCGVITDWGVYQMLKLPFGLRNAPAAFQRIINKVFENVPHLTCYIDDIIVHTQTFDEHIKTLELVFNRLSKYGMKLKGEKCDFMKKKVIFLGHEVSSQGYSPSLSNCEVIEKYPEPKDLKGVKRFLGMLSFFRKFIPNFANIANPLTRLSRSNVDFTWGEAERKAFFELKEFLTKSPCLKPPKYDSSFHLFCDASQVALGATLMQEWEKGQLHPIAYWSRTITNTEAKWPITHLELSAIVYALASFRHVIFGSELHIYTDHRPLTFLFSKASTNAKINRWLLAIQEYEPKVTFIEGQANKIADALSRECIEWSKLPDISPIKEGIPYTLQVEEELKLNFDLIEKETLKDPILAKVVNNIRANWMEYEFEEETKPYYEARNILKLKGNVIRKSPLNQIVIPESIRIRILKLVHKSHQGIVRTKARLRRHFWWPNVNQNIEEFIAECSNCQRNSDVPPRIDPTGEAIKWPVAKYPMERMHADLAGPVFGSNFLIIVDAYSGYPFVYEMKSTSAFALVNRFREIFGLFGSVGCLVTDNGPQFTAEYFENFILSQGVIHLKSAPYHPSSNGMAERQVKTFKRAVKKLLEDKHDLKTALFIYQQEYRATPRDNGESPAQKFLGREIRTELDAVKLSLKQKKEGDKIVPPTPVEIIPPKFSPGDPVWVKQGSQQKFAPGTVLEQIGNYMFKVSMEDGGERTVHADQAKPRRLPVRR